MRCMSVVMSSKGPQCSDTDRVWTFFRDNPVDQVEWIVQGTDRAEVVWDAVNAMDLPKKKKAHPLVVVWESESRTMPLARAIEPGENQLFDLIGVMEWD